MQAVKEIPNYGLYLLWMAYERAPHTFTWSRINYTRTAAKRAVHRINLLMSLSALATQPAANYESMPQSGALAARFSPFNSHVTVTGKLERAEP